MIFEIFWILFFSKKINGVRARPKDNLIILPLHAEMNSACSGLNEEGGNTGKRKLPGLGVSDVLRMSGRWLRRLRLKKWWQCWLLMAEEERKRCRRRESAERRGKTSRWLCLSPVRIWVHGEAETPSVGGGGMFLWGLQGLKKQRGERTLAGRKTGEKLIFWLILDPINSSLRPWNPPIFIGGGRGQSSLHWKKIAALDSDGKDSNRWLKVEMVYCQIVKSAAAGCLSWPLWGGATSVYLPVSLCQPYPNIKGCLVISFMQVLENVVDVRYIKCTCKVGNRTSFFR